MNDRLSRVFLGAVALLLLALVAQPYIDRLFFSSVPRPIEPRASLTDIENTAIRIFERASPSVVQVAGQADATRMSDPREEGGATQSGTGFVWDAAGHVVTNNHVVAGASALAVRFATGEVVTARAIGGAPNYDLAVLRVDARQLPPPLPLGSSHDLKVGQLAFAIGNPFGLDQSLTTGVISALKRRLPTSAGREITDVIQTDAAINPGNSGGPLLDSAGRLIGVNTAIFSPSGANAGIGFAIPVDVVNRVVPQLIRSGRVPTPGIGIVVASEADAARLGVKGLIIVRTAPGSPAARAGLRGVDPQTGRLGDVIVAANGKPVLRLADLTDALEQIGVGESVELSLQRGGETHSVRVGIVDIG